MASEMRGQVSFPFSTFVAFVRSGAVRRCFWPCAAAGSGFAAAFCFFSDSPTFDFFGKVLFGVSAFGGFAGAIASFFNFSTFAEPTERRSEAMTFGFRAARFPFFISLMFLAAWLPLMFQGSGFAPAFLFASFLFAAFAAFFFAFFTGCARPFRIGSSSRFSGLSAHPTASNAKEAITRGGV